MEGGRKIGKSGTWWEEVEGDRRGAMVRERNRQTTGSRGLGRAPAIVTLVLIAQEEVMCVWRGRQDEGDLGGRRRAGLNLG
jgi:hypothetical protein